MILRGILLASLKGLPFQSGCGTSQSRRQSTPSEGLLAPERCRRGCKGGDSPPNYRLQRSWRTSLISSVRGGARTR